MERLTPASKHYAWGSPTALAEMFGWPATGEPLAELWFGAHPAGSAFVERGGRATALLDAIDADPEALLGPNVAQRFGHLPFLMKVLAAGQPLSLQVHPTLAQAAAGFEREESAGVAVDAPDRFYRDRNHKPELICALTPFTMLCGFRPIDQTLELLADLDVAELKPWADRLRHDSRSGLRDCVAWLLAMVEPERIDLVTSVVGACGEHHGRFSEQCRWIEQLAFFHPDDNGVVIALLLNFVELSPGQAVYLGAGNLHSYLHGVGVELMANSDNVIRAGLTAKSVDAAELVRITDFAPLADAIAAPVTVHDGLYREVRFPTLATEFELSRIELGPDAVVAYTAAGPEIIVCTSGSVGSLAAGEAAFVAAATSVRLDGVGVVHRAVVPAA